MSNPTLPQTQPNTAPLPNISLAQFRQLVDRLQAERPESASRIERGANIVTSGRQIRETAETGVYVVQSYQQPTVEYRATSFACTCPDHERAPEQRCKHVWAVVLLHTAGDIAARQARERMSAQSVPYALTVKAERVLCRA